MHYAWERWKGWIVGAGEHRKRNIKSKCKGKVWKFINFKNILFSLSLSSSPIRYIIKFTTPLPMICIFINFRIYIFAPFYSIEFIVFLSLNNFNSFEFVWGRSEVNRKGKQKREWNGRSKITTMAAKLFKWHIFIDIRQYSPAKWMNHISWNKINF